MKKEKANIKEIFTSIQGEGAYIGVKQLFIRFCGCNLACEYCDTNFDTKKSKSYTVKALIKEISSYMDCHSVSFTGGEPLLQADFLKMLLPFCPLPVYLETNATLAEELKKVVYFVDYISADIKLPSCTHLPELWDKHEQFFSIAAGKNIFAKVVFNQNITDEEIEKTVKLASKYNFEIILQPEFNADKMNVNMKIVQTVFDKFLAKYNKVRLIPQVHKFLNVR